MPLTTLNPHRCADKLKVLADPVRLAVIERLSRDAWAVTELAEALDVSQPLLSHHLKVLREAGLVVGKRSGKRTVYRLAKGVRKTTDGRAIDLACCQLSFGVKPDTNSA